MKLALSAVLIRFIGILLCVLIIGYFEPVHAFTATFVTKGPAPISECDKLRKTPASAIYSLSIYQREGWPLWRNVCYWSRLPIERKV